MFSNTAAGVWSWLVASSPLGQSLQRAGKVEIQPHPLLHSSRNRLDPFCVLPATQPSSLKGPPPWARSDICQDKDSEREQGPWLAWQALLDRTFH